MWTHHFTFDMMEPDAGVRPEDILMSYNDEEERTFGVMFFLEDVRLQRKETRLQVEEGTRFVIRAGKQMVSGILGANERGRLDKISFAVRDKNPQQAIWFCQRLVSYLLSSWSLVVGGAFRAYGLHVLDEKNKVSFRSFPDLGVDEIPSVPLFMPLNIELSKMHLKMLSLYREARNSQSPYYALLCAFKVMECFLGNQLFQETDKTVAALGLRTKRKRGVITRKMLEVSRTTSRYSDFEGIRFDVFMEKIRKLRNKVAHAIETAGDMYDFDSPQDRISVSLVASLSDLIARAILIQEIKLVHTIQYFQANGSEPPEGMFDYEERFLSMKFTPVSEPIERWLDTREFLGKGSGDGEEGNNNRADEDEV